MYSSIDKRWITIWSICALIVGSGSLILFYLSETDILSPTGSLLFVSLCGWSFTIGLLMQRQVISTNVEGCARRFGVDNRSKSLEGQLENLLEDIYLKSRALVEIPLHSSLVGERAMGQCLEQICELIYELLQAESVEVSLSNPNNNLYRSSFVKGIPIKVDIHDTVRRNLSEIESVSGANQPLLFREISFAGQKLGMIRVALPAGRREGSVEKELMNIMMVRCGMILIGHGYSEELLKLHRSSTEVEKTKTGFLATLSHEIRGPLGIILNAVELVLDGLCGNINNDQRETLNMIHSNGRHLLDLINDVLDYAKVESGMLTAKGVEISSKNLLEDLALVVRPQAEAKKHVLTVLKSEANLGMICDRRHARQILINILTNAIKYTPDGGTIEMWGVRENNDSTVIHVRDTGVGIRAEDFEKVFTPFGRIENGYSQKQSGTGLGMPLTKSLVEINGGELTFDSQPGKGSHFMVRLPYATVSNDVDTQSRKFDRLTVHGRGEIVLLLAPPDSERTLLERYFKHAGFLVVTCSTAEEMHDVLKGPRIHLFVIDNEILDQSNNELLVGAIQARPGDQAPPIIVVSSRGFAHDVERYLMMGVDRCFVKPVELREFGRTVRSLLDQYSKSPRMELQ